MAAVTVATSFRPGTTVSVYKIKKGGLEHPLGTGVADANGSVTISANNIPAGAVWVRGEANAAALPPESSVRNDGLENPLTVRATAA